MSATPSQPPPYRKLGLIRHHFPEMTLTEKGFVVAFMVCGLFAALIINRSMDSGQMAVAGVCMVVMSTVLGYWMRHDPNAVLNLLIWPFSGRAPQYPRGVLLFIRAFGVFAFFSSVNAFPYAILPDAAARFPGIGLITLAVAITATTLVLRKPRAGVPSL